MILINLYSLDMTATDDLVVNLDDIERALWRWSEWRADQRGVDAILGLVQRYGGTDHDQAAADTLECARREAAQIVQSARDEAAAIQTAVHETAERAASGMKRVSMAAIAADAYRDGEGAVWVRLGVLPDLPDEPLSGTRKCSQCGAVKKLSRYRKDKSSRGGRRAQCADCENAGRRNLYAEKRNK
jgi:hypothetical protein